VTDEIRKLNILSKPNCYPLKNQFESFIHDYSLPTLASPYKKVVVIHYPQVFIPVTKTISYRKQSTQKSKHDFNIRQRKIFFGSQNSFSKRSITNTSKEKSRFARSRMAYELKIPTSDKSFLSPVEKMFDLVKKFFHLQTLQLKSLKYLKSLFTKTPIC
jgi:hypothetical protein